MILAYDAAQEEDCELRVAEPTEIIFRDQIDSVGGAEPYVCKIECHRACRVLPVDDHYRAV